MKHAMDTDCGGITTFLDREGRVYGYDKNVWFAGRTMYTFCVAYNTIKQDPAYLEIARNMYDFLTVCEDERGRLPFVVNREGKALVTNDAYYSETFATIGCAEYYLATGREEVRERAHRYFDIAYDLYRKELSREPRDEGAAPVTKALGPSMILLSVCQTMRKLDHDKYHPIAAACAEEILCHLTPYGLLENIGMNGEFYDTPVGREVNPGHSLEAAWFLLAEGVYRDDERMKQSARQIVDISMKLGYKDGGIIAFCDCKGHPSTYLEWDMKIWWPQCEALIATRLCYTVFGDETYLRWYEELRDWVFARYPDRTYGEWYGYMHYDGTLASTLKGNVSKGPFHLPRMLILIDRLERGEPILQ